MNANERSKKDGQQGSGAQQGGKKDSGQQAQQSGEGQQYGEGNYKATRDYNAGLKEHVEHHDIEREARDAAPKNADEEREMNEAEAKGRSKARGGAPDEGDMGKGQ